MDSMEKELWDAFYGKTNNQERCSVLTEADYKHNKGMLNEGFMSDKDIHNQFSGFEVLDFSKEGEHSGYIELSFPNADEVDYDSSVITGYTIYEDGKVAFDNWLPDDVYNEVAEYVKQHHSEELDEGCGKKSKKKLKEYFEPDAAPNRTALINAIDDGLISGKAVAEELISIFSEDECESVCNMLDIEIDTSYATPYKDTLYNTLEEYDDVDWLVNKMIQEASDDQCKDVLIDFDMYDEDEELDEGCGKKKKKKSLKESDEEDAEWKVVRQNAKANPSLYGGRYTDKDPRKAKKEWLKDKKEKSLKESDESEENPYTHLYDEYSREEILKILDKFKEEYNFLYKNRDQVAGFKDALDAYEVYIKNPEFKKILKPLILARMERGGDFFSSDREVAALMFALDSLGYLDRFDGITSSMGPVIKEFKA